METTGRLIFDIKELKTKSTLKNLRGVKIVKDWSVLIFEDGYETMNIHSGYSKVKAQRKMNTILERKKRMNKK